MAEQYERGRADYPPAVVGALAAELGLGPGAAVLDLAAGTGKLTRALLAARLDVVAVEPLQEMRARLVPYAGAERVREGRAEAIPAAVASFDAVTVADAFHWFDAAAAVAEIARVLRPRGGLAVITATPDWSGASWAHDVGSLIAELRPSHPQFEGPSWQSYVDRSGFWEHPREVRVTVAQAAGPDRVLDYVASMSWIAALEQARRAKTLNSVRELVLAGTTPAVLHVRFTIGLTALIA